MHQHVYAVNALVAFPANGSKGRATRSGHIDATLPLDGDGLKTLIAGQVAEKNGCPVEQVEFVEFTFTEIPTA
jgi:CO/xanthine dehydrogenase Mo-binding subunit